MSEEPSKLNCPKCGKPFVVGWAGVRDGWSLLARIGPMAQHLMWWPRSKDYNKSPKKMIVARNGGQSSAWKCSDCKLVMINSET